MIPPPTTSSRPGTSSSASAPVLSMMRGSSGRNGSEIALDSDRDDGVVETDRRVADRQHVVGGEGRLAMDDGDLALLGEAGQATGQPPDHGVLPCAERREVDLRLPERDAVLGHLLRLRDDLRRVQQRLGRDAPDVQADAAERVVALDERRLQPQVGSAEGSCVPARPGPDDHDLRRLVDLALVRRCGPCGLGDDLRLGLVGRRGRAVDGVQHEDERPLRHPVLERDAQVGDLARARRGDVHRRLVGLQRDERVLGRDVVAHGDVDLDDRDVLEVPDVGDLHVDRRHQSVPFAVP